MLCTELFFPECVWYGDVELGFAKSDMIRNDDNAALCFLKVSCIFISEMRFPEFLRLFEKIYEKHSCRCMKCSIQCDFDS